jgi:predicted MFS family arabinose efflux permease
VSLVRHPRVMPTAARSAPADAGCSSPAQPGADRPPAPRILAVLALCSAVGVGTVYFTQGVTSQVASDLGTSLGSASMVATAPQVGYAVGIALIVPMVDRGRGRRLLCGMFATVAVLSAGASLVSSLPLLVVLAFLLGVGAVASPVIGPLIANLSGPRVLGRVNAMVLSACIAGLLSARGVAAVAASSWSWRAPFVMVAALALICCVVVLRLPPEVDGYRGREIKAGLASSIGRWARSWRAHPELRGAALHQAGIFATFTATWSTLLWALHDRFGLGSSSFAALSSVAVVTMVLVPMGGRAVDAWGPHFVDRVVVKLVAIAAVLMCGAYVGGAPGMTLLVTGVLVLDTAMQVGSVANTTRVQRIDPAARGALTSVHMTVQFLAGGIGSLAAALTYSALGWAGVCLLLSVFAALAATALLRAEASRPDSGAGRFRSPTPTCPRAMSAP